MIEIDDYEPKKAPEDGEAQSVLDFIVPVEERVDLGVDIAELKKVLHHEFEYEEKWDQIDLSKIQIDLHDQALLITESREEYIKKRKALASTLRAFNSDVLVDTCPFDLETIQSRIKEIIDAFKKDFDFLAGVCKSSETAYLSLYKLLRDAPNPSIILHTTRDTIEHTIQSMQRADKHITKLSKSLEEKELECEQNKLIDQDEMLLTDEAFQTKLQASLLDMKSTYEQEITHREHVLRDALERSKFEAQEKMERLLSLKETELEDVQERLMRLEQECSTSERDSLAMQVERYVIE